MIQNSRSSRPALFVAHPGHELRLFGWMLREKPVCMVLTTGSRSGTDKTRVRASADLLTAVGGHRSELFGVVLDRDFYAAVLAGNATPFLRWKDAAVEVLVSTRPESLVIDGWQLYSVAHDLTHVVGRLAAEEASHRLGYQIRVLQYDVVPSSLGGAVRGGPCVSCVNLSERELAEKRAAIDGYPGIELEVIELRRLEGDDHARTESLFLPPPLERLLEPPDDVPKYESFGEQRRAAGIYSDVIRWRHVEKIVRDILATRNL
ncbi:MAG: hypothetical protein ACLP8B_18510 [Xanthobacteraceae bacterium]